MLWLVIELNIVISIFCFYLAWKIWRFRQILLQVEQTLSSIENYTNHFLKQGHNFFTLRQQRAHQLRQLYRQLELQVGQVQQVMAMFWLLRTVWHRLGRGWR